MRVVACLVSLVFAGCCVKSHEVVSAYETATRKTASAYDAALARIQLVAVPPRNTGIAVQPDGITGPDGTKVAIDLQRADWQVVALGDRHVLWAVGAGMPEPVARDHDGRLHVIKITGPVETDELKMCGCDPGRGIDQRPQTVVWEIELGARDALGPPIEVEHTRYTVDAKYERDTGRPGECHAAP